eukprot:5417769-Pleurochrysis_carterae.AAC.1
MSLSRSCGRGCVEPPGYVNCLGTATSGPTSPYTDWSCQKPPARSYAQKRSSRIGEGGSSSRSDERLSSECSGATANSALHSANASLRSSWASSSSGVSGTT